MLFMVIGRMLPHDVNYRASWVDPRGARCFQVVEARDSESLDAWVSCWDDLIDFEIVPVESSTEFWARTQPG